MRTLGLLKLVFAILLLWGPTGAHAQLTADQQNAIRNSCRSDFMSNCSGVTPGGTEAFQCLQKNSAKLSPACRTAVSAVSAKPASPAAAAPAPAASTPAAPSPAASAPAAPPAAPTPAAPAPAPAAKQAAPAAAPSADLPPRAELLIARNCALERRTVCNVPAGGGRILACLAANEAKLTPRCKLTLAELRSMR